MLLLYFALITEILCNSDIEDRMKITLSVDENVPVNKFITDLKNILEIPNNTSTKFSMLKQSQYFHLSNDGIISVAQNLDCDEDVHLCDIDFEYCVTKLLIIINNITIIVINIIINDLNDNKPSWPTNINVSIAENSAIGSILQIPQAIDKDRTNKNNEIKYELLTKNLYFELYFFETDEKKKYPKLKLKSSINREKMEMIPLIIYFKDSGTPPLSNNGIVKINILDVNDNYPYFKYHKYNISIHENFTVGKIIPINIKALDADSGEFGKISYKHSISNTNLVKSHFEINSSKGYFKLIKPLNYDNGQSQVFTFVVLAYDHGIPSLSGSTTVIINVIDVNDEAPIIKINKPTRNIIILENNKYNQSIADITVHDMDNGLNGRFDCTLYPIHKGISMILKNRLGNICVYNLIATKIFDREQENLIELTLSCTDFGIPPLTSIKSFNVVIKDSNDNRPIFAKINNSFSLLEHTPIGTFVLKITATDIDESLNGDVVFYLLDIRKNNTTFMPFIIDSSGNLFVNQIIDRHIDAKELQLIIIASDKGNPSLSSQMQLTIHIVDINNYPPVFSQHVFYFTIDEDAGDTYSNDQFPKNIGKIKSTDDDDGDNSKITFSIVPNIREFQITNDGILQSVGMLDREEKKEYYLTVIAVDGTPQLIVRHTATTSVIIRINDINDNCPTFIRTDFNPKRISYKENIGYEILHLNVEDKDEGENGKIDISIKKSSISNYFSIIEKTKSLKVSGKLPYDTQGLHKLTLIATDRGNPSKSSSTKIEIYIEDSEPQYNETNLNSDESKVNNAVVIVVVFAIVGTLVITGFTVTIIVKCRKVLKPPADSYQLQKIDKKKNSTFSINSLEDYNIKIISQEGSCIECQRIKNDFIKNNIDKQKILLTPIFEHNAAIFPDNLLPCMMPSNITPFPDVQATLSSILPYYSCYQHSSPKDTADQFNKRIIISNENYSPMSSFLS